MPSRDHNDWVDEPTRRPFLRRAWPILIPLAVVAALALIVLALAGCVAQVSATGGDSTVNRKVTTPKVTTTVKKEWSKQ